MKTHIGDDIPLALVQVNVLTLHPVKDMVVATSARMEDIDAKLASRSVSIAFLQEARTAGPFLREQVSFWSFTSGCTERAN